MGYEGGTFKAQKVFRKRAPNKELSKLGIAMLLGASKSTFLPSHLADKRMARSTAFWAKKTGRLKPKPCRDCGDSNTHMHHHDYSKPLDVIWLCRKCHAREHRRLNSIKSGVNIVGQINDTNAK